MLYIASDHGGYKLKKRLIRYLKNELNKPITDMGPSNFVETDDYPDYATPLAKKVAENKDNLGILICGTGNGVCVTANKINGIRAILGYNIEAAALGKEHNNANILCLAGRVLTEDHAMAIVKKFLETSFTNDPRHARRLKKIAELEK
jgi:ribose 5-phosphate isomerase B